MRFQPKSWREVMQFIKTEILRPATDQSCPLSSSLVSIKLFAFLHTDLYLQIFVVVSVDLRRPPSSFHGSEWRAFLCFLFSYEMSKNLSLSLFSASMSPNAMGKIVRIRWWLYVRWLSSPTKAGGNQCLCDPDETSELVLNESTSGKLPVGIKLLNKRKCVCRMVWPSRNRNHAKSHKRTHRIRFGRCVASTSLSGPYFMHANCEYYYDY